MANISFTDAKERIRQAVDIVDLVGGYMSLRRQGRNFVGLCPWHDDTRPSMQVNPERQTWKCWVCDKGGDIFTFLMEKERIEFVEALRQLAERANIPLEKNERKITPGSADDKKTLYDCCAWAERQFHEFLLTNDAAEIARHYYEDRQISRESIEKFKLGFAPNEWNWLTDRARRTAFSPAVLEAVGLIGRAANSDRVYDRFKGRVIFPIHDPQGRTIAFGGRVLPQWAAEMPAKYINSPETRLFSKSDQLYALDLVREQIGKTRSLTVVEGYTDVVMCHQFGVNDVVACLGTALNERHISLIKRFADTVFLVLDGDAAGQRRTNEILDLFVGAQVDLRILTLPEEFDPCEFLLERSADEWRAMLQTQAVDALEHKVRTATRGVDLANDTYRSNQALEGILQTIAQAPRPSVIAAGQQQLREKQILARLSRAFGVDLPAITARLEELRKARPAAPEPKAEQPRRSIAVNSIPPADAELLELLARHAELTATALQEISDEELSSDSVRTIFQTYRRLEEAGELAGDAHDFGRVLSEIEDPALQSLLVAFDERAEQKAAKAGEDPPTRLRGLIRFFQRRHEERDRREVEASLEKPTFEDSEKLVLLNQILDAKRRQQGLIAPTDG